MPTNKLCTSNRPPKLTPMRVICTMLLLFAVPCAHHRQRFAASMWRAATGLKAKCNYRLRWMAEYTPANGRP